MNLTPVNKFSHGHADVSGISILCQAARLQRPYVQSSRLEQILTATMRAARLAAMKAGSPTPDDGEVLTMWANDPTRTLLTLTARIHRDVAKL